jgi:hypothetical protein
MIFAICACGGLAIIGLYIGGICVGKYLLKHAPYSWEDAYGTEHYGKRQ